MDTSILVIIGVILGGILLIWLGWMAASESKEIEYRKVIDDNEILVKQNKMLSDQNKDLISKMAELSKVNTYNKNKEWRV